MPIYQYRCLSCSEISEVIQKIDEPPMKECPHCGGKVRKMIGPIGIVFKGKGFHVTDYGRGQASSTVGRPEKSEKTEKKEDPPSTAGKKSEGAGS